MSAVVPAAAGLGKPATLNVVAAAALTVTVLEPVKAPLAASDAVTVRGPADFSVTVKVWRPSAAAVEGGFRASTIAGLPRPSNSCIVWKEPSPLPRNTANLVTLPPA